MKYQKKLFTVVVEQRQTLEIDVEAFDARGARGQIQDRGVVEYKKHRPDWRIVGSPELIVVDAYEAKEPTVDPRRFTSKKTFLK